MEPEELRLEYVPLSQVKKWPCNPKLHDQDNLGSSIERFGYVQPILIDERTGQLVAGHGRIEILAARKERGEPAPSRIKVNEQGEWLVPMIRGVRFASDAEAEAYLIADNRLVEIGGWDEKELAGMLADMQAAHVEVVGIGYETDEIDVLIATAQLAEHKIPESEHPKGQDPRQDKFWVWAPCTDEKQMRALIARFGNGKSRELSAEKLLSASNA